MCDKKFKKQYFYMFKSIIIYINEKYGLDSVKKSIYYSRLNKIIKNSYKMYEIKKRASLIKLFLKHYF